MAGLKPERKSAEAIAKANRDMFEAHDRLFDKWREERLGYSNHEEDSLRAASLDEEVLNV